MEAIPRRNSFSSASINSDLFRDPPTPDEQHDLEHHIPPTGLQETAFGNEHMTSIRSGPETESQQAQEISHTRLHTHNSDAEDQDDILSLQPAYPDAFFPQRLENPRNSARNRIPGRLNDPTTNLEGLVTRRTPGSPIDRSPEVIAKGKRKIFVTKCIFITCILAINGFLIFATWWWSKYYYIYLPLITITVALNCVMVISVVLHVIAHRISPEAEDIPPNPESIVLLLPCYNENREEVINTLDSLVGQVNINEHMKAIMIVCDGRVRGAGMEKTTAEYLLEDILTGPSSRDEIVGAYTSWDHSDMDVVIQKGSYGGVRYICIVKQRNQGKRDSLLLVRSFLYNFNIRATRPAVILSPYFFGMMTSFLTLDANILNVDILVGADADTGFTPDCVFELMKQSHYKHTLGVCGYVAVDFSKGNWSIWFLYQSAEYTISQCLRRLHQSIATHKVSCLPGCCQLLKICEETCGDRVLLDLFGYCPTPVDGMLKQIRATASEDRNHICLLLANRPESRTRQALKACAYTEVPSSWAVFLSQRRRWTLGATSNDLFLLFAPGVNWFERILAFANVLTWTLNIFIMASIAAFIKACTNVSYRYILAFASVMIFPLLYYVAIVVWMPRNVRERAQYLAGLFIYVTLGPFLNITVLMYALWNMDNFAWGKTRQVVDESTVATEKVVGAEEA